MAKEPGTIYSDDEVECFSDKDEEEEEEDSKIPSVDASISSFFKDLQSENSLNRPLSTRPNTVEKYMKRHQDYDIDAAIDHVREEINDTKLLEYDIEDELYRKEEQAEEGDEESEVKDLEIKDTVKVKVKQDLKKERKKKRREREDQEVMLKDKVKFSFEDAPPAKEDVTFLEMNLSRPILKAVAEAGYETPTPIQGATIPVALRGRDICACAATGTGKTAAFMLPILQRLLFKPVKEVVTRVLVLVPTRELGLQVYEVTQQLSAHSGVTTSLAVGGLKMSLQTEELLLTPDIIIATPGRLIDHIHNTPSFSLKEIEVLVLDEADRMLDEFFAEQLGEVVRQCCPTRQTMLFSATMTDKVRDLVAVSLKDPVRVFVNNNLSVAQNLKQEFVRLSSKGGRDSPAHRLAVLAYLLLRHFRDECIVFVPRRTECHRLHVLFGLFGLQCGELHGNLKQTERFDALNNFRTKKTGVLFATDVAARGLDIKGVKTVINYTVPRTYEMYIHRVGRTARAGFSGRSVTLAGDQGDDYTTLRKIMKNSLSPLYERVVGKKTIEEYRSKVNALEASVDDVLQLETEKKDLGAAERSVEGLKEKLSGKIAAKAPKRNWFQTPEEVKSERERLKMIIAGKAPPPRKPEVKKPMVKKQQQNAKPKRNKKKKGGKENEEGEEENHNVPVSTGTKRKSFFDKDLTQTDPRALKRLRKGPSFKEKKDFAEKRDHRAGGGGGKNHSNQNNNKFKKANKKMGK